MTEDEILVDEEIQEDIPKDIPKPKPKNITLSKSDIDSIQIKLEEIAKTARACTKNAVIAKLEWIEKTAKELQEKIRL